MSIHLFQLRRNEAFHGCILGSPKRRSECYEDYIAGALLATSCSCWWAIYLQGFSLPLYLILYSLQIILDLPLILQYFRLQMVIENIFIVHSRFSNIFANTNISTCISIIWKKFCCPVVCCCRAWLFVHCIFPFLAVGYHHRSSSNCERFFSIQSILGPDMTEIKLKRHKSSTVTQPKVSVPVSLDRHWQWGLSAMERKQTCPWIHPR